MSLTPVIAVVGPTASGKTALAIEIAKKYNGEIVSADSMQIYKGMDIGTAKPTKEEKAAAVHHMIDIVSPSENYSVAQYVEDAKKVIEDITSRGKLPIICGGTGLYVDSLLNNIKFADIKTDNKLREELRTLAEEKGVEALFKILEEIDPEAAKTIHKNNIGRVIRAIEVNKVAGITMSEAKRRSKEVDPRYNSLIFGLSYQNRNVLYSRIEKRVDLMIEEGLVDEVANLLSKGIDRNSTSMQAIGYKEFTLYLDGKQTLEEAVDNIKLSTRHYAKRQLTWFRRNEKINWLEAPLSEQNFEIVYQKSFKIIDKWLSI